VLERGRTAVRGDRLHADSGQCLVAGSGHRSGDRAVLLERGADPVGGPGPSVAGLRQQMRWNLQFEIMGGAPVVDH
jgi:hypothetical protein